MSDLQLTLGTDVSTESIRASEANLHGRVLSRKTHKFVERVHGYTTPIQHQPF